MGGPARWRRTAAILFLQQPRVLRPTGRLLIIRPRPAYTYPTPLDYYCVSRSHIIGGPSLVCLFAVRWTVGTTGPTPFRPATLSLSISSTDAVRLPARWRRSKKKYCGGVNEKPIGPSLSLSLRGSCEPLSERVVDRPREGGLYASENQSFCCIVFFLASVQAQYTAVVGQTRAAICSPVTYQ